MKILKIQVLNGPNQWSNYRKNLIQVKLDLEEMEAFPSDKIPGFNQALKKLLPGMVSHECSEGVHGGFFERLDRGTWMGHIIEHVALEIQSLAGMETGYGRTRGTKEPGVYNMVFSYQVEQAGIYAATAAFNIVQALAKSEPVDLQPILAELVLLRRRHAIGPSTQSIIDAAVARGIPWKRIGNRSKIQLGHGCNQMTFQATMTCNTSSVAVATAGNKHRTKELLDSYAIPVPKGDTCTTHEELVQIIPNLGFPLVIKPLDGNQGKGATINITNLETAKIAFSLAKEYSDYVVVEKYIPGYDHRLLVINGKLIAAARRMPAHVVGNGVDTVGALMEKENQNPLRGLGHESVLTQITFDRDALLELEKAGFTLDSIPASGQIVSLKSTANLSTGGTATDVTDSVHPENRFLAERVAKIIGLDICGIDLMCRDISQPVSTTGGAVIEVNAAPGFRMHLAPTEGKPRPVGKAVVDMLYPEGKKATIPIFAVTGTNGKTTTTRLLAHLVSQAGYTAGYTTTDGVYIDGHKIKSGDCSGPSSGALVLRDPTVEFAILETARGGLLRSGLCFENAHVGIITNIAEDHLGLNDIHNLEDLANVKAVVARSVYRTGHAVLNADDVNCVKIADELRCNIVYFSMDHKNPLVSHHIANGNHAVVVEDNAVVWIQGEKRTVIHTLDQIPLTDHGKMPFMTANVLAAVAAAAAYGLDLQAIRAGLSSFIPSYETTPGRMNKFDLGDFKVLVDYAHNPHGFKALKAYLDTVTANRKVGIIAGIGDRRDQDTIELGALAATLFDHVIIRQEHGLRGSSVQKINDLLLTGLQSAPAKVPSIEMIDDEPQAIAHALEHAISGDYIVALSDQYQKVIDVILEHKAKTADGVTAPPKQSQPTRNPLSHEAA